MSHSAVFRDSVYSGWTLWIAAQKEAKINFKWSRHLASLHLTKQFPSKDSHAKTLPNVSPCALTKAKEHLCVARTKADCLGELQSFSSLVLPWCKLGRICSQEAEFPTFFSSVAPFSLLYVYVSRLFGTLNGKAICFFVHRYWFLQLFLSKCFLVVLYVWNKLVRHCPKVVWALSLSLGVTNKA